MEIGQIQMPEVHCSYIQPFFLNKVSANRCKPLVNFQSSGKVDYDHYVHQCFVVFMEQKIFRGPYSSIMEAPVPSGLFLIQ